MGKVPTATATTTEMKRKKKKGRPSKNPLPLSTSPKPPLSNSSSRRSTRRNPNHLNSPPQPEFDDDDDERKEKKVKLVVRLPQSDDKSLVSGKHHQQSGRHSHDSDSGSESGSDSGSDPEDEDQEGCAKKRKLIGVDRGSDDGGLDQDIKEVVNAEETSLHGSPLDSGPTAPLPDKKLLAFILDRLQKKDTYGVFSEPVDPDELPDYFEIIKQPMDFGTVRKKLGDGVYKSLEELEADVFLICSNAMEYNASDTVYHRQARSIQELAKRDFKNLRHEGDNGEPQPKVVRRGRPPSSKNQKKTLETSPMDRVGTELSSGATLANGEDKATGSNSYNLRKASTLFRSRSTDPFVSSYGSRNGVNYSEWLADWNDEFPASILRADMKYGKKQFTVDENKRDTYREFHPLSSGNNSSMLYDSIGNMKRLVPVGLQESLAYARSLARYAANLGPVAWKMASKKIEAVLPAGVQYGPGWVGDNGPPPQPLPIKIENQKSSNSTAGDCSSSKLTTPSSSDLNSAAAVAHGPSEGVVEAIRKLNSQNEPVGLGDASSWRSQFPPQQNQMHHTHRNGFSGMFGHDFSAAATSKMATPQYSCNERVSLPSPKVEMVSMSDLPSSRSSTINHVIPEQAKLPDSSNTLPPGYLTAQGRASNSNGEAETWNFVKSSWQAMPVQQRHTLSVPPDLNVRVPAGSPGSSLQIGSPQQPDLALQL